MHTVTPNDSHSTLVQHVQHRPPQSSRCSVARHPSLAADPCPSSRRSFAAGRPGNAKRDTDAGHSTPVPLVPLQARHRSQSGQRNRTADPCPACPASNPVNLPESGDSGRNRTASAARNSRVRGERIGDRRTLAHRRFIRQATADTPTKSPKRTPAYDMMRERRPPNGPMSADRCNLV
jgi:hypothetical protein